MQISSGTARSAFDDFANGPLDNKVEGPLTIFNNVRGTSEVGRDGMKVLNLLQPPQEHHTPLSLISIEGFATNIIAGCALLGIELDRDLLKEPLKVSDC